MMDMERGIRYMLFNVLVVILLPIMCAITFFAYRQGVRDGQKLLKQEALPPITPIPFFRTEEETKSAAYENMVAIMKNIDEYGADE